MVAAQHEAWLAIRIRTSSHIGISFVQLFSRWRVVYSASGYFSVDQRIIIKSNNMKIEWAPARVPLKRRLETLVTGVFTLFFFTLPLTSFAAVALLLVSNIYTFIDIILTNLFAVLWWICDTCSCCHLCCLFGRGTQKELLSHEWQWVIKRSLLTQSYQY